MYLLTNICIRTGNNGEQYGFTIVSTYESRIQNQPFRMDISPYKSMTFP